MFCCYFEFNVNGFYIFITLVFAFFNVLMFLYGEQVLF